MLNPRLASRYAKSLIDLAVEQNSLEATLKDVQLIDATIRANRELAIVLKSPVIKADKKDAVVEAIFGAHLAPLTRAFIKLLTTKGREDTLAEMATAFIQQYRLMKKISQVRLITASPCQRCSEGRYSRKSGGLPCPDRALSSLQTFSRSSSAAFVLEMGDKLVDASIRRDLNDIKKQFLKNLYVPDLR
jgi:F-type H+-transporting ATPase subunit delta